jgi:anti-sigma factor RsiW
MIEAAAVFNHPTERTLRQYVSNELGSRRKQIVVEHLEACHECRKAVTDFREVARRFRDLEKVAIAHAVGQHKT